MGAGFRPDQVGDDGNDSGGPVRHAETPELAQEALVDAVILIFKAQVLPSDPSSARGSGSVVIIVQHVIMMFIQA